MLKPLRLLCVNENELGFAFYSMIVVDIINQIISLSWLKF